MRSNKSKNTKPEVLFRKALWQAGIRGYRVHWKKAPGKPDIAFPSKKIAIFLNGCFWHRCPSCNLSLPKNNQDFWKKKFARNVERDREKVEALKSENWQVLVIWECELKDLEAVAARLINELPRENKYELPEEIESHRLVAEQKSAYGV